MLPGALILDSREGKSEASNGRLMSHSTIDLSLDNSLPSFQEYTPWKSPVDEPQNIVRSSRGFKIALPVLRHTEEQTLGQITTLL